MYKTKNLFNIRMIAVLIAVVMLFTLSLSPVYANGEVPESTEPAGTESTGEDAGIYSASPTSAEEAPNPATGSALMLITGYCFTDGSIDVWMTGNGVYIGASRILTASRAVSFRGSDDPALIDLINMKAEMYSRIGISLNDAEQVMNSLVIFACFPDGNYIACELTSANHELGLAIVTPADRDATTDTIQLTEDEWPETPTRISYSASALETAGNAIMSGMLTVPEAEAEAIPMSGVYSNGLFTPDETLPDSACGSAVVSDEGALLGIIIETEQTNVFITDASAILYFLDNAAPVIPTPEPTPEPIPTPEPTPTPETAPTEAPATETADTAGLLEMLENAVTRAKEIDLTGYTEETAKAFTDAIEKAEWILAKNDPSEDEIITAGEALNDTKAALKENPEANKSGWLSKHISFIIIGLVAAVLAVFLVLNNKKSKAGKTTSDSTFKEKLTRILGVKTKPQNEDDKEKKPEDKDGEKKPVKGYGGEEARKADVNGEDPGTSVLNGKKKKDEPEEDGDDGTTLLDKRITRAYLTDSKGRRTDVTGSEFWIGKETKKVNFAIHGNPTVSRRHCCIKTEKGKDPGDRIFRIVDNDSLNGTQVNGVVIDPNTQIMLHDGYTIIISDEEFVFHIEEVIAK